LTNKSISINAENITFFLVLQPLPHYSTGLLAGSYGILSYIVSARPGAEGELNPGVLPAG